MLILLGWPLGEGVTVQEAVASFGITDTTLSAFTLKILSTEDTVVVGVEGEYRTNNTARNTLCLDRSGRPV